MPFPLRSVRRTAGAFVCLGLGLLAPRLSAQIPQVAPGQQLPTPDQAREALQNQPQVVERLRQRLLESGLTPDQVRARLRASGYPENSAGRLPHGSGHDPAGSARPPHAGGGAEPRHSERAGDRLTPGPGLGSRRFRLAPAGSRLTQVSSEPIPPGPTLWPIRSACCRVAASSCSDWRRFGEPRPGSSRCSRARWTRIIGWARATCWY